MRYSIIILLAFFGSLSLLAQSGDINGTVLDKVSGEPLVGATVVHAASGQKTITDFDGNFSFDNVEEGVNALTITYVSYNKAQLNRVLVKKDIATQLKIKLSRVESKKQNNNYLADKAFQGTLS